MDIRIRIDLLSDTCFAGDAAGYAAVDREIEMDAHTGLPRLRGRALKGLLVEEAAILLSSGVLDASWQEVARRLFGEPGSHDFSGGDGRSLLSFPDGGLPAAASSFLGDAIKRKRWTAIEVRDALTIVRRQTAVERATGAPQPRSLRSTRLLRAGLLLESVVVAEDPVDDSELALLAGCCATLRRIGLCRNAGWGKVKTRLVVDGQDETAKLSALRRPPVRRTLQVASGSSSQQTGSHGAGSQVVTFRLQLEAPAIFPDTGGGSNTVETLTFVPGSALLGAMARRFLQRRPVTDPARDQTFQRLFLDGEVRWLNVHLEGPGGARMVPPPLSFAVTKHSPDPPTQVHDRSDSSFEPGEESWRTPPGGWFLLPRKTDAGEVELFIAKPKVTRRLHHQRTDREAGRSTKADGAMFVYSSLDEGQTFRGVVLCETPDDTALVKGLLEESSPLFLGRSRTATYGGAARISDVRVYGRRDWTEVETDDLENDAPVTLTFLSDYVGRDAHGESTPQAAFVDIATALGMSEGEVLSSPHFLSNGIAEGFVARWEMPRPRETTLRAGAVFVLAPGVATNAKFADLAWNGLGARRNEGYGRVAVQMCRSLTMRATHFQPPPRASVSVSNPADRVLDRIRESLIDERIREALNRHAMDIQLHSRNAPSSSLLSRLRDQVRRAVDSAAFRRFMDECSNRPAGKAIRGWKLDNDPFDLWFDRFTGQWTNNGGDETPARWRELVTLPEGSGLPTDAVAWPLLRDFMERLLQEARRKRQLAGEFAPAQAGGAQ